MTQGLEVVEVGDDDEGMDVEVVNAEAFTKWRKCAIMEMVKGF